MKRVMLAMSGGVDSSAAALVLMNEGYDVTGVTLCLHQTIEESQDARDAKAVADKLGFPHITLDWNALFREQVMERFVQGYLQGETPNPCIECNRYIKFGALWEFAKEQGADFLATGHYARITHDKNGKAQLHRAADPKKDQSYVLYSLTEEQLNHAMFPLGDKTKSEIRALAEEYGLVSAKKPDSQDICFIPDGDYGPFLERYTGEKFPQGDYVDENGAVLGRHQGMIRYTIGQRKGLGVAFGEPRYVLDKNAENNTVTLGEHEKLFSDTLYMRDVNLMIEPFKEPIRADVKARYRHEAQSATVYPPDENGIIRVVFDEKQRAITPGQAAVMYDGDRVLGGGTILKKL